MENKKRVVLEEEDFIRITQDAFLSGFQKGFAEGAEQAKWRSLA